LDGAELVAYEVLGRGKHPALPESPAALFHIAESIGVEAKLNQLFIKKALETVSQRTDFPPLFLNTHPAEIDDPEGQEGPFEEYAETVHTLNQSRYAYRLIVLRKARRQLNLLEGRYFYHAIITDWDDQDYSTIEVIRWHRKRCNVENHIKELKLGLGLETLPCGQFMANAAYFRIGMLAYNLLEALKVFALPRSWRHFTLKTLRFRLLRLAGLVVRHARRLILKLPHDYLYHDTFYQAHLRLAYG